MNALGTLGSMGRWYLIHTKPSCEAVAQINLERQGYDVYCPRYSQVARFRGDSIIRVGPLFPRYMFLQVDAGQHSIGPVQSTLGVASIVRFGQHYTVVPAGVIERLRQRADPATGLHHLCCEPQFETGSEVQVVAGPFKGLKGVFQRKSGDERVVVLLELLGQATPVGIPREFVMPRASHAYG